MIESIVIVVINSIIKEYLVIIRVEDSVILMAITSVCNLPRFVLYDQLPILNPSQWLKLMCTHYHEKDFENS